MQYSKEDCVESLRQLASDLDHSPEAQEYKDSDYRPSVKTLENKFGSWNEAKQAAGLEITEHGMNNDASAAIEYAKKIPPAMRTNGRGYEQVRVEIDGVRRKLYIHRLLAVAEFGFDAVSEADDVHHRNGIPWDNRPKNVESLSRKEHMQRHHGESSP